MNSPQSPDWSEEAILSLLEADPTDPRVQQQRAALEANPEAMALARSLQEVEGHLSADAFANAESAVQAEFAGSVPPDLDENLKQRLLSIPQQGAQQAPTASPKPSWFKGIFSGGSAPSRRDLGGGPSPQMTILITMAALIFVIVGFKRLFQDAPPALSGTEITRMKGSDDEGLALTLRAQSAGGETSEIPLIAKGKGTWQATVPLDASLQVMVEGPGDIEDGERWTATGDLQWRFPGGNRVPVLGPEGITLEGEGPNWTGPATKPISLPALKARGFGPGHQLVLSLSLEGDTQRVVIVPGAAEGN